MKKIVPALALLFFTASAFSQVTFAKGYLIDLDGDTLKGEVKMNPKKDFDLFNKVFFKDETGVQKNYKPDNVKGYGFDNKNFISSTYEKEPMLYKVLSYGNVMLLEMMYETQVMNEISYKSEYFLARKGDAEYMRLKPVKYKKQLSEFFKDNTDIIQNIDEEKKFEIEKIIELVNQYNSWAKLK